MDLEPVTQIAAGGSHTLAIEAAGADCDKDNIRDEIEIRDDPGLDCNSDGVLDSCIAAEFTDESVEVSPFGSGDTITLSIIDSPRPMLPVQIEIEIRADLGSSIEYLVLSLNDVDIDYIFNAGGKDCPTTSQFCKLSYPAADYIALLTDNGDAVFELRASSFVSTVECPNSFATLAVNFETDSADCNGNGLPDMCELLSGDVPDADGDGVPDTCQGTAKGDHNRDGIADLTFFNPSTRRIVFSYLEGTTVSESLPAIDAVGNGWLPIAQADIDGDGESDFILRNATTRQTYGWLMDGTAIASSAEIGYALPTNVQFLTMADVDGDDDDDIVWIDNTDKKIYAWRLAGTVLVGGGLIGNSTGTVFAGAGDIDADGDDIVFYADESRAGTLMTWHGLRQQHQRPQGKPHECLADFVAPLNTADWAGAFAVTAGIGIEAKLAEFAASHDDYRAIMLKSLADRLAEAAAEWLHERVRKHYWGYATDEGLTRDQLVAESYQGIRPAPGYPACPDHTAKAALFELLDVPANTGMSLTENFAMTPAAAVAGFYLAHPEAHYFAISKIGRDQLEDWARRTGMPIAAAERWLAPLI